MKDFKIIILLATILLRLACGGMGIEEYQQVENTKKSVLSEDDFDINYKSFIINDKINVNDATWRTGSGIGLEARDYQLVSQNENRKVWELTYPDINNTRLRLICGGIWAGEPLSYEEYLLYADLIKLSTKRGLKVGDSYERLVSLYGKPTLVRKDKSFEYALNNKKIIIRIDPDTLKINRITLDYNLWRIEP